MSAGSARAIPEGLGSQPGEVIIKFRSTSTPNQRGAIERDMGLSQVEPLHVIGAEWGRVTRLGVDEAIARYRNDPSVEFIEPNYIYRISATPNDSLFDQQWSMRNDGQTGGIPGADISAPQAWDVSTGSRDVLVAIVDTGMDYRHPDLIDNAWINTGEIPGNGIDDDGDGFIDDVHGWNFANNTNDPLDDNGHGTHVSGTLGATGNNGRGVVGVAWQVRLLPVKALDATGSGTADALIRAFQYAIDRGARVINASWGGFGPSEAMKEVLEAADRAGIVLVAAAGNNRANNDVFPLYPASYDVPNIIAVAATDDHDRLASFSSYGATSVDLAAPGVDIISALPHRYGAMSGTSMAAPHVSGALALMLAHFPGMDGRSAKSALLSRVDVVAALAGKVATGGRLNAFLPIAGPDGVPPAAIADLAVSATGGTWVTLHWTCTGDDGAVGTASRYQVRYSATPVTDANFESATAVGAPPRPLPAGTPQEMTVSGLDFSSPYFFAIKALDEYGNASPASNAARALTLGPPHVQVTPLELSATLPAGSRATRVITLANTGDSELHFEIQPSAGNDSTGPLLLGPEPRLARTTSAMLRDALTTTRSRDRVYDEGGAPMRSPLHGDSIRITNVTAGGSRILLLHGGGDVSEIREALADFADIDGIDDLDAQESTPSPAELAGYRSVIVIEQSPFLDAEAIGDLLADYVDQGGGLVMALASFIDGLEVRGRLLRGGYVPFDIGTGPSGSSTLGAFSASHPIMSGVSAAAGGQLGQVTLAPGADLVASWTSGQPFVATRGTVAAVNAFFGASGFWTGQLPQILHNAAFWSSGGARLSAVPTVGVIPAGGQLSVVITINAAGVPDGRYDLPLIVHSDDPASSGPTIPVHVQVTGAPHLALGGQDVSLESVQDFTTPGARSTHSLSFDVPPGSDGALELIADGDFGKLGEQATATVEGVALPPVGQSGIGCSLVSGTFHLTASQLAAFAKDGVLRVDVQNSTEVDAKCSINRHSVRLRYAGPSNRLEFGTVFVGTSDELSLSVRNIGSDVLTVASIQIDSPEFTPAVTSLRLEPHASTRLAVSFLPRHPGMQRASLTLLSDDPDRREIKVALSGHGRGAPELALAATSVDVDLETGEQTTRVVAVRNRGASPLTLAVDAAGPIDAEPADPGPSSPGPTTDDHPTAATLSPAPQTQVLLVQDQAPWGTDSIEEILRGLGIAFEMVRSTSLSSKNLSRYRLVILPSGQSTPYYTRLAAQTTQLSEYVAGGGVLEAHVGWGYLNGDPSLMTLPGGMRVAPHVANLNFVLDPRHPLMAGIPSPFSGITTSSRGYLLGIPAGASTIAADDLGETNLVAYPFGRGAVIAGCQSLEIGYFYGEWTGKLLLNMIQFAFHSGPAWMTAAPTRIEVPPGGSASIVARFDATGLSGGGYAGSLRILSNDPKLPDVRLPATLHVTSAPDIGVAGALVTARSTRAFNFLGAVTTHALAAVPPPAAAGELELRVEGDFATPISIATASAEGIRLGQVGGVGLHCASLDDTFPIRFADLARLVADSIVHVEVRNSYDLRSTCAENLHQMTLRYRAVASPVDFGQVSVGVRDTSEIEVSNHGADVLTVEEPRVSTASFAVTPGGFSLAPGEHRVLLLTFGPTAAGRFGGTLTLRSNDPDHPEFQLALGGTGVLPPGATVAPATLDADSAAAPRVYRLLDGAPNPFMAGASTLIAFELPTPSQVDLAVYAVDGRRVRVLANAFTPAGRHQVRWDGRNRDGLAVSSGIYWVRLQAGAFVMSRRVTFLR